MAIFIHDTAEVLVKVASLKKLLPDKTILLSVFEKLHNNSGRVEFAIHACLHGHEPGRIQRTSLVQPFCLGIVDSG